MDNIKQMIVVRKDLNMRKGKIVAQASHASFNVLMKTKIMDKDCRDFYLDENDFIQMEGNNLFAQWLRNSFKKICVYVNSEKELLDIYNKGLEEGMIVSLIQDNGETEFHGIPTYTCLAFEPLYSFDIDTITGHLKLL